VVFGLLDKQGICLYFIWCRLVSYSIKDGEVKMNKRIKLWLAFMIPIVLVPFIILLIGEMRSVYFYFFLVIIGELVWAKVDRMVRKTE
jgi:hypothetical protein